MNALQKFVILPVTITGILAVPLLWNESPRIVTEQALDLANQERKESCAAFGRFAQHVAEVRDSGISQSIALRAIQSMEGNEKTHTILRTVTVNIWRHPEWSPGTAYEKIEYGCIWGVVTSVGA